MTEIRGGFRIVSRCRPLRKLFLASFGAHDAGERLLKAALATGVAPADILYLCPSPRRKEQAKAELLRLSGKEAIVPPVFASLTLLARDLHDRFGSARRLLPELKPLLVQRILSEENASSKPQTSGRSKARPSPLNPRPASIGYARAVAGFITEVRRYVPAEDRSGLGPRLKELLVGFEKPLARLLECLECLESYESELGRLNWTDDEGMLAQAVSRVARAKLPPVLVLDSFVAPNRLEADLIHALVENAASVLVLNYGSDPRDPDYAQPERFTEFIQSLGGFETERMPLPSPLPAPEFLQYPDIEEEVKGICRAIIARPGDTLGTFVAVPALAEFAPLVKRVFDDYGVHATVYPETNLSSSPPIVAVLELLRCLDTDFERIAAAAALGSPFLPGLLKLDSDRDPAARDRAAAALNHYSRRARIIKGRQNWNKLRERVLAAEDRELEDAEDKFLQDVQKRVQHATRLIRTSLTEKATLGTFASSLKQLLGRVGFLSESAGDDAEAEHLADRKSLYDILDAIAMFELEFGGQSDTRARFIKTLVYLVENASRSPETPPAGVTVVDMTETLGIHPRRLYFCGLTETSLPSAYSADPVMPDRVRKALGMPDLDWHQEHERFHFRRTLEAPLAPPVLSYHSAKDGQPVLPTPFLTLKPIPAPKPEALYSEAEEQVARGEAAGRTFAESALQVDFSADREVLAVLAADYGPARPVSVTQLERYRRCPYEFYIDYILGIETPEEPRYDIDARQWGLVIHLVMEKLYRDGPVEPEKLEAAALKALDATLAEVELPVFWAEVTRRVFSGLLPEIVRCETGLREGGFLPGRAELRLRGRLTEDIALKGRADRVDTSGRLFRILDYKTGSPRNIGGRAVLEGTHLQLPLYAWLYAAEHAQAVP
ncbi:PD-(D/E)XK nuclease family protein, partial [candidate division WOR-3 bacterium]|nr:PD-(D/E)XK nuclease family protein [candidate division WOR-3 bacterium]